MKQYQTVFSILNFCQSLEYKNQVSGKEEKKPQQLNSHLPTNPSRAGSWGWAAVLHRGCWSLQVTANIPPEMPSSSGKSLPMRGSQPTTAQKPELPLLQLTQEPASPKAVWFPFTVVETESKPVECFKYNFQFPFWHKRKDSLCSSYLCTWQWQTVWCQHCETLLNWLTRLIGWHQISARLTPRPAQGTLLQPAC